MMRRKGRDVTESLELGNAVNFTQNVPIRKFSSLKLFKYLILIALGVLIHSMYKRIIQVHSGLPDADDVDKRLKDIEDKIMSNQKSSDDAEQKEALRRKAEEVFEKVRKQQQERDKMDELKEQLKEELREEQKEELSKNDELLKSINQKLKEQQHVLDETIKDKAVEVKFDPKDEKEKKDLKQEIVIENEIANILDTVNEEHVNDPKESEEEVEPKFDEDNQPLFNQPRIANSIPKKSFVDKTHMIAARLNPDVLPHTGHHSHDLPAIVTAASQNTMVHVIQLIESIQKFFPEALVYVFDLDLHEQHRRKLSSACNVRVRGFWSNLFPEFVQNLTTYHWRPLVIQTALAEFGDILWINPNVRITSTKLKQILHETEDSGVTLIGQTVAHTTYAVTNPSMYKYIPTNKSKLYKSPHIEMMALILHNTDKVHENFMKILTACAIEEHCLNPKDSKWDCDFDFTGKLYAKCHRFDESAINIILKNMFEFDESKFSKGNSFFQPYDAHVKSTMKICRHHQG